MNDILKAFSKILQPFGYHIRPRAGINFLRVSALEAQAENGLREFRNFYDSAAPSGLDGRLDSLKIYLRTCLRQDRNINKQTRPGGTDSENAFGCLWSLVRSINHAKRNKPDFSIELIVLDDRSLPEHLERIKQIIECAEVPHTVLTTSVAGQGASLHETFSKGRMENALVYFVEDDYLHEEDAILRLCEFYNSMANTTCSHLVIYPQEARSLYSNHYPSYIVAGTDRHWRSIAHATHTFLTHGKIVDQYWHYFENTKYVGNLKKRRAGSEAKTTNKLFQKIPGFSPLKPCAVHFQSEGLLPPLYDWRPLWKEIKATLPSQNLPKND